MPNQESKMVPEDDPSSSAPAESSAAEATIETSTDNFHKALRTLSTQQLRDLLERNPALKQDMDAELETARASRPEGVSEEDHERQTVLDRLGKLSFQDIMTGIAAGKNRKDMASYKFWKTQPVPSFDEGDEAKEVPDGPIEQKTVDEIPTEPGYMHDGFEWVTVDITDEAQMKEVYTLLNGHYVEDHAANFRFDYSQELLKWALMSPGWRKEWHVGVRVKKEQKEDDSKPGLLVAFISAVPLKLRVREQEVQTGEVNFLCVHKKLRNKRLAPSLIKEITRRINREGIWQGLYTGGTLLPTPITTTRYFHRPINWQRLYHLGFSSLPPGTTPAAQGIRFHIAATTSLSGFRDMRPDDAPKVRDLLDRYLARYDMVPRWDEAEFDHWMVDRTKDPRKRVVFAYVVETPDGKITDFISFYRLESTVIAKKDNLHAGYLYYYATEVGIGEKVDVAKLRTRLSALTNDMLVKAKHHSFDVMNALSLMDNALFLEKTKFKAGDGSLHYYLFNYRVRPIAGGLDEVMRLDADNVSKMGLIML